MSVNERRLGDALRTYAEGVEVTTFELNDKQRELHARVAQGPPGHQRPMLVAAVAIIVLLAAAAAGMLWLRRPDTTLPASPQGSASLTGLWRYRDQVGASLFVVRRDGSFTEHTTMTTLLRGAGDQQHRILDDGQAIVVRSTDAQDRPCRSQPILARSDGQLTLGRATVDMPGCLSSSGDDATLSRVSPRAQDVPPTTEGPLVMVTDPVQLDGLWLLQDTSTVFAVDEIGGPALYLIDGDGDLQPAPDAHGALSVDPDGLITLGSTGCADTTLKRAQVQGRAGGAGQVLTAVVDADPCNRFPGHTTQTWIRIF